MKEKKTEKKKEIGVKEGQYIQTVLTNESNTSNM